MGTGSPRSRRIADGHLDWPAPSREFPAGGMAGFASADAPGFSDLAAAAPARTRGQKARLARDLTIAFAWARLGWSHRQLADVFDLPRSRIAAILKDMESRR